MSNLRLLTFDNAKTTGKDLARVLEAEFEVSDWYTVFSNCLLLETEAPPKDISVVIQRNLPLVNHICIKFLADNASGLLPAAISKEIASKRAK